MIPRPFLIFIAIVAAPFAACAESVLDDEARFDAYVDFLRDEIKAGKTKLIQEVMDLKSGEAAVFWPIYREYEERLIAFGTKRQTLIKDYARLKNTGLLDEEAATDLLARSLSLEEERVLLLRTYTTRLTAALNVERAAQFYQIESRVFAVVDTMVDSEVPLLELSRR